MDKYVADFETTTDINDCRVWAYGTCLIDSPFTTFEYGNNIDYFMKWCESGNNKEVLFHNLSFDGEFILSWLMENGFTYDKKKKEKTFNCIISQANVFYQIEVIFKVYGRKYKKVIFKDSYKKLPFKASKIAKDFNLETQKLEIDYNEYREIGHILTKKEIEYLKNDCLIIAQALKIQYEKGLKKLTIGADALFEYKTIMGKKEFERLFPILDLETDADIRKSYKGGYTYCNPKFKNKMLGKGLVYDVNSLYPYVMTAFAMPYGAPIPFDGEYSQDDDYNLYIQHLVVSFKLKENHIPTIQNKNGFKGMPGKYLESAWDLELHLTNIDLKLMYEHYDIIEIAFIDGWKFRSKIGMFDEYIFKWYAVKENSTGAIKQLAKLLLNNLYGKFATNPNVTGKIPYLDEHGVVKYKDDELEFREPVYTAVGCFITAWARNVIITASQDNYDRFVYCDTDSLHLVDTNYPDIEIHQTKLGAFKLEYEFIQAKYIGAKAYIDETVDDMIIKCAGMHDNVKEFVTFNNFKAGKEFKGKGQLKKKHVKGGVVLYDGGITIRER